MHKKNRLINELVPADDLYWDEEAKKHVVVSKEDQEKLFKACFNCGLEEDDVMKVYKHYAYYKASEILFKHFLEGNIGIYGMSKSGSPVFDKLRDDKQILHLFYHDELSNEENSYFDRKVDQIIVSESASLGLKSGVICSSQPRDVIPFDKMFKTIVHWCLEKEFDLWDGENPDNDETWAFDRCDEEVISDIKQKGWRLTKVEPEDLPNGSTNLYLEVELGNWFHIIDEDE